MFRQRSQTGRCPALSPKIVTLPVFPHWLVLRAAVPYSPRMWATRPDPMRTQVVGAVAVGMTQL